jgi:hypothetical protein
VAQKPTSTIPRPTGRTRALIVGVAAASLVAVIVTQASARTVTKARSQAPCTSATATRHLTGAAAYKPAYRTYDDLIEDAGDAPDFCAGELVTNDSTTITIGVHAHNRDGFQQGDSYTMYLDTDQNPATGGAGLGAEFAITFSGPTAVLAHWNGTTFEPTSASVPVEWVDGYGPVLVFEQSTIGNPAGFNLVMTSANGPDGDRAPDAGSWTFELTPLALEIKTLSLAPARAGYRFQVQALVLRSDFDAPLMEGTIGCTATIAGHRLSAKSKFAHNRAICAWRLPRSARARHLTGAISVTFEGVAVKRSFSRTVR